MLLFNVRVAIFDGFPRDCWGGSKNYDPGKRFSLTIRIPGRWLFPFIYKTFKILFTSIL